MRLMRPMPPFAAAIVSRLCRSLCLLLLLPAAGRAGAIGDAGAPPTVATPAPAAAAGALAATRGSGSGSRSGSAAAAHLHALFDREWEMRLRDEPLLATEVGRHEYDALLPEVAYADLERRWRARQALVAEEASIDLSQLAVDDAVNVQIWRAQLEDRIAEFELGTYQMPFNADSGFHTSFAQLPDRMPFATRRDYENYLGRLRAWPRYVGQQIELMRMGIRRGFTVPRATLTGYERTISAHVVDDPAKSVFYKPFEHFPAAMPEAEREVLRAEARAAILDGAVGGYRRLLDFYRAEYLPHARATIGASELPDGRAYYAHQIRHFTTLDLSPEEIHRIGRAEVERIAGEMQAVIRQVGFQGDFAAFVHFLRTDPRFYPKTGEELLKDAAWIAKRIDGKLPSEFKTLPRLPCRSPSSTRTSTGSSPRRRRAQDRDGHDAKSGSVALAAGRRVGGHRGGAWRRWRSALLRHLLAFLGNVEGTLLVPG
jgi:uncharacterized protein (DUF885 family)